MSVTNSGNRVHDQNCNAAEMTRQVSVAAAGNSQTSVRNAEIVYYRACRASAIANGLSPAQFIAALQELGTGGS